MNLFLPYPEDLVRNATLLDDSRLNKQVVEAYQIGNIIVKLLNDPECKPGWRNHPSTLAVWNNGKPKLPWLKAFITACDNEWIARGFHRSPEFSQKISELFGAAESFAPQLSLDPVLTFVGGGETIEGPAEVIGKRYRAYLEQKYQSAPTPPRWTSRKDRSV